MRLAVGTRAHEVGSGGLIAALFVNAASLMGTTVVTSVLGYVFWIVAARTFDPASVGFAAAVISALTFLAMLGKVGLGTLLIGELRRYPGAEGRLILGAAVVAGLVGLLLGAGFAILAPALSAGLASLAASPLAIATFALSVGITALALVLDEAVVGLLRGGLQLLRNLAVAVLKLAALVALAVIGGSAAAGAIYVTWPAATLVSLGIVAYLLRDLIASSSGGAWRTRWAGIPLNLSVARQALLHHAVNFFGQAAGLVMPVLVASLVSVAAAAYLFVAYTISSLLTAVSSSLTTALFATGARDRAGMHRQVTLSLGTALASAAIGIVGVFVLGDVVLAGFGPSYPAEAGPILRILVLGAIPVAIKTHYGSVARIRGRIGIASVVFALGAALEIAFAAAGARTGDLTGLAAAWVVALWLEGFVLAIPVLREVRIPRFAQGSRPS